MNNNKTLKIFKIKSYIYNYDDNGNKRYNALEAVS